MRNPWRWGVKKKRVRIGQIQSVGQKIMMKKMTYLKFLITLDANSRQAIWIASDEPEILDNVAVSYTHLTLPTILLV